MDLVRLGASGSGTATEADCLPRALAHRHIAFGGLVGAALAVSMAACGSRSPIAPSMPTAPPSSNAVPIAGAARLTADHLIAWFNGRSPRPAGTYAATVPVETLAAYFIEEGVAEGVTGDVAFVQSVVETGWFRFGGIVPASFNNFGGIGATDTNPRPAMFLDARTGVRAQIQHLRAYADPTAVACAVPPLHNPCADPRFHLVLPKGKAPTWNQMGNGNWTTGSAYASSILRLYDELRAFNGR
jgi:hypothetical protein